MRVPKLAIENHQFTIIVISLLVLSGLVSFFNMPRSEDPQVSPPASSIVAVYPGANPTVLEELVVARVVIDSLSTLILHSNEATMPRAVQRLSGRVTQSSHSIMYILEDGVHNEKTYATFSYLADAILRFRINDSRDPPKHEVRMERMRGTETSREWHEFLIER